MKVSISTHEISRHVRFCIIMLTSAIFHISSRVVSIIDIRLPRTTVMNNRYPFTKNCELEPNRQCCILFIITLMNTFCCLASTDCKTLANLIMVMGVLGDSSDRSPSFKATAV